MYLPVLDLPRAEVLPAFTRTLLREGVEPMPPSNESLPWLASRMAGVATFIRAMCEAEVAFERFREFDRPVFFSYGSLSNETWERKARRLAKLFPNITIERFEGLSHLNTSHIAEPERVVAALSTLWTSS